MTVALTFTSGNSESLISAIYLIHAISGSLASVIAISILYPLDSVRTRLQAQESITNKLSFLVIKDLINEEGWHSLYKGWKCLIISLSVSNFVYFYVFHGLKIYFGNSNIYKDFLFGSLAGCITVLISNPFWVASTRLKLQGIRLKEKENCNSIKENTDDVYHYDGIMDCFIQMWKNEGIKSYFLGVGTSLFLVSNPVINFMIYEFLKRNFLHFLTQLINISVLYVIFAGIAKLFATILTYPLQVVQTRLRAGLSILNNDLNKKSLKDKFIFLFRGLESKITQTILNNALLFLFYEHMKSYLTAIFNI